MTREDILERLEEVFEDVLEIDDDDFSEELSQDNCEDWDSLAQMTLLVSIENEFGVHFEAQDMAEMKSVAQIVDALIANEGGN